METAVQEKFDYLESVLGQFIVTSSTSLSRLERNISILSSEMNDFKDEMRDFKSMVEADIAESRADRKAMNKKWGELANKMGTVVEDIVAPCIGGVAREYFQVAEFDYFAIRLQKKNGSGTMRREFDVVAESENHEPAQHVQHVLS